MKIFIIDDEPISIFIIQQKLLMEGIVEEKNVLGILSAKMALDSLSKCREEELPDIILLDLAMPEMDGWQFLDALALFNKRLMERCRIYILTSSLNPSDEARAKGNSMLYGFLQKPLSAEGIKALRSKGDSNLNQLMENMC